MVALEQHRDVIENLLKVINMVRMFCILFHTYKINFSQVRYIIKKVQRSILNVFWAS